MNTVFGIFPKPDPLKYSSQVYDLKTRLDWGEPGLTIIEFAIATTLTSLTSRVQFRCRYPN